MSLNKASLKKGKENRKTETPFVSYAKIESIKENKQQKIRLEQQTDAYV